MARGRRRRSGKQEEIDAPLVQEAIRLLRQGGTYRSNRQAAIAISRQLPGGEDKNFSRIYNKILDRKDEPGSEDEEEDALTEGLIRTAVELAGESPEVKIKRLTRLFRITAENNRVVETVLRNLEREGIILEPDLKEHLERINLYIVLNEKEMAGYEEKVRNRKRNKIKRIDPGHTKNTPE